MAYDDYPFYGYVNSKIPSLELKDLANRRCLLVMLNGFRYSGTFNKVVDNKYLIFKDKFKSIKVDISKILICYVPPAIKKRYKNIRVPK